MARRKVDQTMDKNVQGIVNVTHPIELPLEPESAAEKAKRGRPVSTNKKPKPDKDKSDSGENDKKPSVKSVVGGKMKHDVVQNMDKMTLNEKKAAFTKAVNEQKNMTKQDKLLVTSAISMSGVGKDFRKTLVSMSPDDISILAKARFDVQETRIQYESRIRNQTLSTDDVVNVLAVETPPEFVNMGADDIMTVPQWLYASTYNQELQLTKMLEIWSDTTPLTRWLRDIVGVGPVFATIIATQLKVDVEHGIGCAATDFINYCGLNDHNIPWIGKKADGIVKAAYRTLNMKSSDPVTWELCEYLSDLKDSYGWSVIGKKAKVIWDQCEDEDGDRTQSSLIKSLAKIPYNKNLKTTMYLIGKSFILNKNRGSKYGRIYMERLSYETKKNEEGAYADQAKRNLEMKTYKKNTESYKAYIQGKLPQSQLVKRASRYATKIFLNHVYEAMYYDKYGKRAPWPYILCYDPKYADPQHVHYITPEVDYIPYIDNAKAEMETGKSGVVTIHNVSETTADVLRAHYFVDTKIGPETKVLVVDRLDLEDKVQYAASVFNIPIVDENEYAGHGISQYMR